MAAKKKILIIEDERPLLAVIKSKLELSGYDVVAAEDGEKGERMVVDEKPDLVLLDILLPKKDGFQVLEGLNAKGINVPIVIISNSGQPVEVDRALKMGVRDYLIKADFSPTEVLEKVEKLIGIGVSEKTKKQDGDLIAKEEDASSFTEDSNGGDTVLIIEDDEFLRDVISQKLSKEGFEIFMAIDATEALALIEKHRPRIVLLDLILPGMDGFEFLAQLKKSPANKDIPVIVLSNLGQKEDQDRAKAAGAVDYLVKSDHTPAEIVQRIRDVIKQKYI